MASMSDSNQPSAAQGVTEQFLENAAEWDALYYDPVHWSALIQDTVKRVRVPPSARILEVGCGGGNATVPLLQQVPDCSVWASDISPQMVGILQARLKNLGLADRCVARCEDAMTSTWEPDTFDLALGASILHHLIDPMPLLRNVCRALKPGGSAAFLEPFEPGSVVMRIIFEHLLRERQALRLGPPAIRMLTAIIRDVEVRAEWPKTHPAFLGMDDKWLFTASGFARMGREAGFSACVTFSHRAQNQIFREQTGIFCHLFGVDELPAAVWEIVDHYDRMWSPDAKSELLMEGGVVFVR